ncbi:MAG: LytTR family DNA-binding domain-containing protein [Lentimicrobium sp.]|nr:LytTR family DNA-binding domain-containing protein [Lentimicrobium sp.]
MTNAVIIDDEIRSRETITEMLKLYCPQVQLVGTGENVQSGIKIIRNKRPQLVFLDIRMPDGSGFDLLRRMVPVSFKIIFVTAYEEYAIKAFKFNAIDYLTKPIDPDELQMAVEKAEKIVDFENLNERLTQLLDDQKNPGNNKSQKVILKTAESIDVLDTANIIRCESDGNYTVFYTNDNEKVMVSRTIKEFVPFLEEHNFIRVHQSHLINIDFLKRFKKDELICILKDNTEIPVSYRKRAALLKILKTL